MIDPPERVAERVVREGEGILWVGRPDPHRLFRPLDAILVPAWLAFTAIGVAAVVVSSGAFVVFPLAFVVLGLYVSVGRLAVKLRRRRRTVYAITDMRVLLLTVGRSGVAVFEPRLDPLPSLQCVRRGKESGDIVFGENRGLAGLFADSGLPWWALPRASPLGGRVELAPGFYDLTDVQTPLHLLLERGAKIDYGTDL